MQLKPGAEVYTADNKLAGMVNGVVINSDTREVTHLVIQKGYLFTRDRLAPMTSISAADEQRVALRLTAAEAVALPDFEHIEHKPVEFAGRSQESISSLFEYSPTGLVPMTLGYRCVRNTPPGSVALRESARVLSSDGHYLGNLECLYTAPGAQRVTLLIVAKGLVFKVRNQIPTSLISSMTEGEIQLNIYAHLLDSLPVNQPEMLMPQG